MKFDEAAISKLKEILSSPKKTVIVTHRNPDGDALGSSLGLKRFLEKKKHEVSFISPNQYTSNLKWIPGTEAIMVFENGTGKKQCEAKIGAAELIFCLDFNSITRLEGLGEHIKSSPAMKVMIDHHQQPEAFAHLVFSDTKYCATSEMIYDIIADMNETELIDEKTAECFYVGLATDNGFFQFNNTTPNAHMVAAALIEKGAQPDYVSEKVNNIFRETRLRFFGYCLYEKLKLVKNNQVAYMIASQAEIKKFNLQSGDSEGLVNYPFKIEGVKMSVYFSEEPDRIKISFRSRGTIDVNSFARTNFEGGGHRNAAGGMSKTSLADTEKKFLEALELFEL
jgi:phosphoesterase RecJ-like protein